jgi:hypothetical protein
VISTVLATPPNRADGTLPARGWRRAAIVAPTIAALGLSAILSAVPAGALSLSPSARTPDKGVEAFAGDVYRTAPNGVLIAVDPRTTPDSAALYNAAGNPLGVTWGTWRSAAATSLAKRVMTASGPASDFKITLGGLIHGATYSLFYETFNPDSKNPVCPAVEPSIELTARHPGSQHPAPGSFIADGAGGASFHARVPGNLLAAQQLNIVAIYDFSGQTYGAVPNQGERQRCRSSFGIDSLRQIIIVQVSP